MRHFIRLALPAPTEKALRQRQTKVYDKWTAGALNVQKEWNGARKSKPIRTTLQTLKAMVGARERCMYCGDSHGTDIEHFWPKASYPEKMFLWANLLLCCTECGRFKGEQLPLLDGVPQLVDPTAEDPWDFLDFDPATGNIVARFDMILGDWTSKGTETVRLLQLDRREALAAAYQRTHRRIKAVVEQTLQLPVLQEAMVIEELRNADDHGLLGWYFKGAGKTEPSFRELRERHPAVWTACVSELT